MRDSDNGFDSRDALTLVVLGAAAGALATYLISTLRNDNAAGVGVGGDPGAGSARDWLTRAAQRLQESRDRIVDAVEKAK